MGFSDLGGGRFPFSFYHLQALDRIQRLEMLCHEGQAKVREGLHLKVQGGEGEASWRWGGRRGRARREERRHVGR